MFYHKNVDVFPCIADCIQTVMSYCMQELIQTQEQFHVVLDELHRVKTDQRQELDCIKVRDLGNKQCSLNSNP